MRRLCVVAPVSTLHLNVLFLFVVFRCVICGSLRGNIEVLDVFISVKD